MGDQRQHDTTQPNYRKPIRAAIMAVFLKRPGQVIWLSEILEVTGETTRRVQAAIGAMARDGVGITTHTRGQAWTYRPVTAETDPTPAAAPAKVRDGRMFEAIGPAKDGSMILEAEDGTLWRATEL